MRQRVCNLTGDMHQRMMRRVPHAVGEATVKGDAGMASSSNNGRCQLRDGRWLIDWEPIWDKAQG
jgi:hypothetical protein